MCVLLFNSYSCECTDSIQHIYTRDILFTFYIFYREKYKNNFNKIFFIDAEKLIFNWPTAQMKARRRLREIRLKAGYARTRRFGQHLSTVNSIYLSIPLPHLSLSIRSSLCRSASSNCVLRIHIDLARGLRDRRALENAHLARGITRYKAYCIRRKCVRMSIRFVSAWRMVFTITNRESDGSFVPRIQRKIDLIRFLFDKARTCIVIYVHNAVTDR